MKSFVNLGVWFVRLHFRNLFWSKGSQPDNRR